MKKIASNRNYKLIKNATAAGRVVQALDVDKEISEIWMEINKISERFHFLETGLKAVNTDIATLWGTKPRPR